MNFTIEGIEKLTEEQKQLMFTISVVHTNYVSNDCKAGMQITKVWIDDNNTVCVKLLNGDWYHYTNNQKWY